MRSLRSFGNTRVVWWNQGIVKVRPWGESVVMILVTSRNLFMFRNKHVWCGIAVWPRARARARWLYAGSELILAAAQFPHGETCSARQLLTAVVTCRKVKATRDSISSGVHCRSQTNITGTNKNIDISAPPSFRSLSHVPLTLLMDLHTSSRTADSLPS